MKRVEKFLKQDTCPDCGGTRLCASARQPKVRGISLDEACQMTLSALVKWVAGVPETLPAVMRPMAESICGSFAGAATRLMELGLGYLALDRAAATLSTGERQRMQLAPRPCATAPRGCYTCWTSPPSGCIPPTSPASRGVMRDLVADGNSVLLVDHDTQILAEADHLVEMGPGAGADGGARHRAGNGGAAGRGPRLPHRSVFCAGRTRRGCGSGRAGRNCSASGGCGSPPGPSTPCGRWRWNFPRGG